MKEIDKEVYLLETYEEYRSKAETQKRKYPGFRIRSDDRDGPYVWAHNPQYSNDDWTLITLETYTVLKNSGDWDKGCVKLSDTQKAYLGKRSGPKKAAKDVRAALRLQEITERLIAIDKSMRESDPLKKEIQAIIKIAVN